MKYCNDLLEAGEGPLVVFTDHINPLQILSEGFKKKGYNYGIIQGSTSNKRRATLVHQFQSGHLDVLIGTIGAANTGYNLFAARNLIFNDLSWNPAAILQAEKRIHRIGQKRNCVIHRIIDSDVDKIIVKTLTEKMKTLEEAT